jgi:hypothetical protein
MSEEAVLFLLPMGVLAISTYLLVTGLQGPFIPWRVILSATLLAAPCALAGYASGQSVDLGMIAFIIAIHVTPFAIAMGIVAATMLHRWRRLSGAVVGLVFPAALFASIMAGAAHAPEPPTLEETYIARTEQLLNDLQEQPELLKFMNLPPSLQECQALLRESLQLHEGHYSLEVTALVDPARDPTPTGSSAAVVAVRFPDGREVELEYYNYTYEWCRIISP